MQSAKINPPLKCTHKATSRVAFNRIETFRKVFYVTILHVKKKSPLDEETPLEHNIPATSELIPTRNLLQTYTFSKLQKQQGDQTLTQKNH